MKNTGIVRRIDELGRIVIPKKLRKTYNIQVGDPMEIYTDGETIVLKKYLKTCECGEDNDLVQLDDGRVICKACILKFMDKLQ